MRHALRRWEAESPDEARASSATSLRGMLAFPTCCRTGGAGVRGLLAELCWALFAGWHRRLDYHIQMTYVDPLRFVLAATGILSVDAQVQSVVENSSLDVNILQGEITRSVRSSSY